MRPRLAATLLAATIALAGPLLAPGPANAATTKAAPKHFKNCTQMHKKYPGGVAKTNKAGKRTTGDYAPKVSKRLYLANKGLDRDKDKIACEA